MSTFCVIKTRDSYRNFICSSVRLHSRERVASTPSFFVLFQLSLFLLLLLIFLLIDQSVSHRQRQCTNLFTHTISKDPKFQVRQFGSDLETVIGPHCHPHLLLFFVYPQRHPTGVSLFHASAMAMAFPSPLSSQSLSTTRKSQSIFKLTIFSPFFLPSSTPPQLVLNHHRRQRRHRGFAAVTCLPSAPKSSIPLSTKLYVSGTLISSFPLSLASFSSFNDSYLFT